jgi:hypothetical protein
LNATNIYSAVLAIPSKEGTFRVHADYFGFKIIMGGNWGSLMKEALEKP